MSSRKGRKTFVIGMVIFMAVALLLLIASHNHAKTEIDDLINVHPEREITCVGSRFRFFRNITGMWGPSWEFKFVERIHGSIYSELQVSLLGEPIASLPSHFIEEIKTQEYKEDPRAFEIAKHTIVPLFDANDIPLGKSLQFLEQESTKYGKAIGYEPLKFHSVESLSKSKVNLRAKNMSMQGICNILAQQVQGVVTIRDGGVWFEEHWNTE